MSWTIYNALQTPDGTILHSKYRHDYIEHIDESNGEYYMNDGGNDYARRVHAPYLELSLTCFDDIVKIRETIKWGRNYDENGDRLEETQWILLKDITDDHLEAILKYMQEWPTQSKWLITFIKEKQYRNLTLID